MDYPTVTYKTEFGKFTLLNNEMFIKQSFDKGSHWEYDIIKKLLALVDEEDTVINIGSHVGTTLIPLANKCSRVFAFEPQRKLYTLLLKNLLDNNITNVIPFNGVVSNSEFEFIYMNHTDNYGTQLNNNNDNVNYGGCSIGLGGDKVRNYVLDDFNIRGIKLITIDTEGSEPFVLLGCLRTIRNNRPILMIEQNFIKVTNEMELSLGQTTEINIEECLCLTLDYNNPIHLGDYNYLYIPRFFDEFKYIGRSFKDGFDDIWYMGDNYITQTTGNRGPYEYIIINENTIIVKFGEYIIGNIYELDENCVIGWSNNSQWESIM